MKHLIIILSLLLLSSCGIFSRKVVVVEQKDSVRVEVKTVERIVKDTIEFEIEREVEVNRTKDSLSYLKNRYSESTAKVEDGFLYHSLSTIPQTLLKPIEIIAKDSLIYKEHIKIIPHVVEVEKELSWLQNIQLYGFWIFLILFVISVLFHKFA